jgi:hypothetical protein
VLAGRELDVGCEALQTVSRSVLVSVCTVTDEMMTNGLFPIDEAQLHEESLSQRKMCFCLLFSG